MTKRNDTYNPTEIRKTIERWYDGTATPAEQDMLVEYFATTADADMPADIAGEAPVFRAIGVRRTSPDKALLAEIDAAIAAEIDAAIAAEIDAAIAAEIDAAIAAEIDAAIAAEIDAAIAAEKSPKNRVGRIPFVARWYSIAAAASVIVILAVGLINEPPVDLSVTSPSVVAVKTPTAENDTLTVKTERIAQVKTEQPATPKDKVATDKRQTTATAIDNDGIIFVTDVAEATEALAMVNAKLEKVETLSAKAIERTFEKTPDISREINNLPDIKTIMRDACSNVTFPTI